MQVVFIFIVFFFQLLLRFVVDFNDEVNTTLRSGPSLWGVTLPGLLEGFRQRAIGNQFAGGSFASAA